MEQLVSVRSLFKETEKFAGQTVKVGGWVRNLRASKPLMNPNAEPIATLANKIIVKSK